MLLRPGVPAAMLNRCNLGRSLDEVYTYGCDLLLSALALAVCGHEGSAQRFRHLDTTSFSLSGASAPESDEQAILLTPGYSKDHRLDVTQAVWELLVSQDRGVPWLSKSGDGNASDTTVFQERAQPLMTTLKNSPSPRYVGADCTLYHKEPAAHWQALPFITRIPTTLKVVSQVMRQALAFDTWHALDAQRRSQCLELCHCGLEQRWLVVHSEAAAWRAESSRRTAQQREYAAIETHLLHLQARRFAPPAATHAAVAAVAKTWKDHQVDFSERIAHKRYAPTGRPRAATSCQTREWQIHARVKPDTTRIGDAQQVGACYVVGTTLAAEQRTDVEVMAGYTGQAQAEGGFRFLKAPLFFVSSLLVKKPCRLQGLLTVMTLVLLGYCVAQRRLRQALAEQNATIPNHINQPTSHPTLRGVLQMLEGIARVRMLVDGTIREGSPGLKAGRVTILRFCGQQVCLLYRMPSG